MLVRKCSKTYLYNSGSVRICNLKKHARALTENFATTVLSDCITSTESLSVAILWAGMYASPNNSLNMLQAEGKDI